MADEIEIRDFDIDPETGDMPEEFYEQEYRIGLEDAAKDVQRLFRNAEEFVGGIQELYDYWDEETEYTQAVEGEEWKNDISCIEFLESLRKQNRLTKQQEHKFATIVERLKAHMLQIKHMELWLPKFLSMK